MCKVVGGEGTTSLVVIPALVYKISQENERGGGLEIAPPPEGRGLNRNYIGIRYICMCFTDSFPYLSIFLQTNA